MSLDDDQSRLVHRAYRLDGDGPTSGLWVVVLLLFLWSVAITLYIPLP